MITRIDSDSAAETFEGMTASNMWQPWPSMHRASRGSGEDGVVQVI